VAAALGGCNVGKMIDRATIKRLSPGILADSDVPQACAVGAAIAPLVLALGYGEPARRQPRQATAMTLIAAGMCAEQSVWEAELSGIQAEYMLRRGADGQLIAALQKDALLRGRRHHVEAARRDHAAFLAVVGAFGAPSEAQDCPARLRPREELLYLLGLTAGLLAVIHDVQAGRVVGVSSEIPLRVARGAGCLDDAKWWHLPAALRAAVWASVPGSAPAGTDPWRALAEAAGAGEAQGVRLGRALQAQVALSAGRDAVHAAAIEAHRAASKGAGRPEVGLLNDYADRTIQHFSDRQWMATRGHRAPLDADGPPDAPATGRQAPSEQDLRELEEIAGPQPAAAEKTSPGAEPRTR
jgi:hypothetical protein